MRLYLFTEELLHNAEEGRVLEIGVNGGPERCLCIMLLFGKTMIIVSLGVLFLVHAAARIKCFDFPLCSVLVVSRVLEI